MKFTSNPRWRMLWILPPVVIGILILMVMTGGKQPPQKAERGEPSRAVRVVKALSVDLVPQAEGYGAVQPAQVWTAVAQVSGRIIEMHPRLRGGEIIPAGEILYRIDPVDYELNLAQANAELAELEIQEQNARASLAIEQNNLSISRRELERIRKLVNKGTASQSNVDESERAMLGTQTLVQNMQNTLALIPSQRKVLEARVAQAERDLAQTTVAAPFNMRVANLKIEQAQYVSLGQNLFEGDAVDRVEVVAQVAMSSLRNLFIGRPDIIGNVAQLNENIAEFTGFRPLIRLDLGNHIAEWKAEFVRISDNVDQQTRTIGIVVAVDAPLGKVKPGYRPPLSKGMFVQVLLRGHTQPGRIVVPRAAIRDNKILLIDAENRLQTNSVKVLFNQGPLSVIEGGVREGDPIVVSDLVPAVDGMLLQQELDEALQSEISRAAEGNL
jgi:RND family efflux transporter MFP subunit